MVSQGAHDRARLWIPKILYKIAQSLRFKEDCKIVTSLNSCNLLHVTSRTITWFADISKALIYKNLRRKFRKFAEKFRKICREVLKLKVLCWDFKQAVQDCKESQAPRGQQPELHTELQSVEQEVQSTSSNRKSMNGLHWEHVAIHQTQTT